MQMFRQNWGRSSTLAVLVFVGALALVVTSCGRANTPVSPSAAGSQQAFNTTEPTPTPTPTPEPSPTPTPTPTPEPTPTPTPTPTPPQGGEGCTPGYWKQEQHFDSWTGYSPDQQFSSVFADAFPGMTLLQVLSQGGGGLNALGRHAVAALLDAASGDVDYDLTTSEVIALVNAAYASGDATTIEALKNRLDALNNQGCPLN